ncbi:MAG: hypothetical protein LC797_01455, partial [Chloroflexi bacterium]|nr:hypothetical protein [Chloroflexota bacterium]
MLSTTVGMAGAESEAGGSKSVNLAVFTPQSGDLAGVGGKAFLVDLAARFQGNLASTLWSPELTGPGAHQDTNSFPGTFAIGADKDHFPGLVVLLSSTPRG